MLQNNNRLTCVGTAEIKRDCKRGEDGEKQKRQRGIEGMRLFCEGVGCNKDQT